MAYNDKGLYTYLLERYPEVGQLFNPCGGALTTACHTLQLWLFISIGVASAVSLAIRCTMKLGPHWQRWVCMIESDLLPTRPQLLVGLHEQPRSDQQHDQAVRCMHHVYACIIWHIYMYACVWHLCAGQAAAVAAQLVPAVTGITLCSSSAAAYTAGTTAAAAAAGR